MSNILQGFHNWNWEKLLDAGDYDPASLAYRPDCVAVANPRRGIKIWTLVDGEAQYYMISVL